MAKRQILVKRDDNKDLFQQCMEAAQKQFKTQIEPGVKYWLPFSATLLNMVISGHGIPAGRITEIFGDEQAGKSTLLFDLIGSAQRMGGWGGLIDVEGTFEPEFACNICGMDPNNAFIYMRENVLEKALDGVEKLVKLAEGTEVPFIIGIDSVAGLGPESSSLGKESMTGARQTGKPPQIWAWFFQRGIVDALAMGNIYLVLLNQTKASFNFRDPSQGGPITVGGKAIRYHASVRMEVTRDELVYDEEAHPVFVAQKVEVVKNKLAPGGRTAAYHFYNTTLGPQDHEGRPVLGIDDLWSCADFAIKRGLIQQAGSWFSYGELKAQGEDKFIQALRENPAVFQSIKSSIPALYRSEYGF